MCGFGCNTRKVKRLETRPAIWENYWSWLETVSLAGVSRLVKVVTCEKNQKPYMENYLLDMRYSISNSIAEKIACLKRSGEKKFCSTIPKKVPEPVSSFTV